MHDYANIRQIYLISRNYNLYAKLYFIYLILLPRNKFPLPDIYNYLTRLLEMHELKGPDNHITLILTSFYEEKSISIILKS